MSAREPSVVPATMPRISDAARAMCWVMRGRWIVIDSDWLRRPTWALVPEGAKWRGWFPRQVGEVYGSLTWHTWDRHGIGGENAEDPTIEIAKGEVMRALVRQGTREPRRWGVRVWRKRVPRG